MVLHESEIRKSKGPFSLLLNPTKRASFFTDLNALMVLAPVTIIAVVIRKQHLADRYARPNDPYHLAMEYGLERVCRMLAENGEQGRITHIVFERRGDREDRDLELQFRRITSGANPVSTRVPLEILFADKKSITSGLQFADLVARPIGLHILRPEQPNRAFDILSRHLRRSPTGRVQGWGLKVFPS